MYYKLGSVAMMLLLCSDVRAQVAIKDILVGGTLSPTYGLGCDGRPEGIFRCQTLTEGGQTFIRMEYIGGSAAMWGALFITVGGDPRDPPRPSEDFSAYEAVILDVRGKNGGERPLWGFKTNDDRDDGREPRIYLERTAGRGLTQNWDLYTIPLDSRFNYGGIPVRDRLKKAYVLTEFVFVGAAAQTIDVRLVSFGPARPVPSRITNGASFIGSTVAAGMIAAIFGAAMGPAEGVGCGLDAQGRMPTTCAAVRVLFDGLAAPLYYVRRDQINLQVPYEVAGKADTKVQVFAGDQSSSELTVPVDVSAPGIFVLSEGHAAALNQDNSINSPQNRASRGDLIILFATGEGQTDPAGVTGKLCAEPLSKPRLACSVRIGSAPADLTYCGCAPGIAGGLQVNARIPPSSNIGELPVTIRIGDNSSQPGVNISVR